jgi:hypothetical protein
MMSKIKTPKIVFLHVHEGLSEMEVRAVGQISSCLRALGLRVESWLPMLPFSDLAIFFGTAKFRPNASHLIKLLISRLHPNFMVFESPVVGRVTQELGHKEPLFRVGIGGFFADHGFAYALTHQCDSTARRLLWGESFCSPEVRFNRQGVVGIALQIPGDASIKGIDQVAETAATIARVRSSKCFGSARIIVRTPPLLASRKDPQLARLAAIPGVEIQTGTNDNKEDFFRTIEFLITFSSTMGVDAVTRGVPACGLDPRSFLRLVSTSTLDDLLNRHIDLNPHYINILANTTWRIEDIFGSDFLRIVMGAANLEAS